MDALDTHNQQIQYELRRLSSRLKSMDVDEDSFEPEPFDRGAEGLVTELTKLVTSQTRASDQGAEGIVTETTWSMTRTIDRESKVRMPKSDREVKVRLGRSDLAVTLSARHMLFFTLLVAQAI
ncbi:hypothetical protein Lal_00037714 [Lupinus albus]|nr:hypothetical protein Lal_00037714 [Lupinus albus]